MVGVPGRSRACHTCRQRRIKCHGERPACVNCVKSGRVCAGYQRNQAFIISDYVVTSDSGSSETALQRANEDGAVPVLLSRWRAAQPSTSLTSHPVKAVRGPKRKKPRDSPPLLEDVAPHNALRTQLLGDLLETQLPPVPGEQRIWLMQLERLSEFSPALENSIMAFCTARISQRHGDAALERQSLSLYTKGLRALQRAIDSPASRPDEQNIAACMALIMYEFGACPGGGVAVYMQHYKGAMRLMEMRGPEAHSKGLALGVLQILRVHTIFQSLAAERRSYLAQPEWLQKPWANTRKSHFDLLVDLALQLPIFSEKTEALSFISDPHQRFAAGVEILWSFHQFDSKLTSWFSNYVKCVDGPLYWPKLSSINSSADSPDLGKVFPVYFHFSSLTTGELLMLYWMTQMMLHIHMGTLFDRLPTLAKHIKNSQDSTTSCDSSEGQSRESGSPGSSHASLADQIPPLVHRTEWPNTLARFICQSAEFFFQEELSSMGGAPCLSYLLSAQACFRVASGNWARELTWIHEVLARIKVGNKLAEHLTS